MEKKINDTLREAGIRHAQNTRDGIAKTLQETMDLIDLEIAKNHGIYPENGGKLGQRELCRRAGIHYQTLQQPAHKITTRVNVMNWLAGKETRTKHDANRAVSEKIGYWEGQHRMVATQIHAYELELNERNVEIRKLKSGDKKSLMDKEDEIARLKAENLALREALMAAQKGNNVTPLRSERL